MSVAAPPMDGWQQSGPADLALPAAIDGIDLDAARRRMGGNDKLLARLLLRFARTQDDAATRIRANLGSGDTQTAMREAHTVKGLAANLGALVLQADADALESALVNQEPTDALVARFAATLAYTVQAVAGALVTAPELDVPVVGGAVADLSLELQRLGDLVADEDATARTLCASLVRQAGPGPLRQDLQRVAEMLGNYDFEAALAELQPIRTSRSRA